MGRRRARAARASLANVGLGRIETKFWLARRTRRVARRRKPLRGRANSLSRAGAQFDHRLYSARPFGAVETLAPFLTALVQHVRARGAFLLKLEPDWQRDDPRAQNLRAIRARSTAETIQPSATIQLDLTADLETILARMKAKWRYNIRLSEKKRCCRTRRRRRRVARVL